MALPQTRAALQAAERLAATATRLTGTRGTDLNMVDHRYIIPALSEFMDQVSHAIDAEADSVRSAWRKHATPRGGNPDDLSRAISNAAAEVRRADDPINHGAATGIQRDLHNLHIRDHDDAMSGPGRRLHRAACHATSTTAEWRRALGHSEPGFADHATIINLTGALLTEIDAILATETRLITRAYERQPGAASLAAGICEPFTTARRTLRRAHPHLAVALAVITAAASQEAASR